MGTILLSTRRLLIGLASIYCIGVVAMAILWAVRPQPVWWLALTNVFALYLFTPLLFLAPAALLLRSRWLRASVVVALVTFLALFGARLAPPTGRPGPGVPLRVVTLNQLYSNQRVDDLITALQAQGADVIAIQELSTAVAAAAQQRLSAEYPYQVLAPAEGDYGLGLLSRYPLQAPTRTQGFLGQQVLVTVGAQQVTLINLHLTAPSIAARRLRPFRPVKVIREYDTSRRASEFAALLRTIDAVKGPLVVLGDFNTSDREPPYGELAARLHDAYGEAGWGFGFTFPNDQHLAYLDVPFPLVRIADVWSSAGIVPVAARVECASGGSDHCMVIADLRVGAQDRQAQQAAGVVPGTSVLQALRPRNLRGGDAPW